MAREEKGSVLVFFGGLLLTLVGFAVLAFDVGRVFIVRNEMQNVADAAALAGANCLTRQSKSGSTTDCVAALATGLNWSRASAKAADQLGKNRADNLAIATTGAGQLIEVGYWNLQSGQPSGGMFSTTLSPVGQYDKPAVRVTITKDSNKNNGPILMLTRLMFGGNDVPMTASAVAVISAPGSAPPGTIMPLAVGTCIFDTYWDSNAGAPRTYGGNTNDPLLPRDSSNKVITALIPQVGQPYELRIGSAYHYSGCTAGQWSSLDLGSSSASDITNLVMNGNPDGLNIGENVYIDPGTKNSIYKAFNDKYTFPSPGGDMNVVVIDTDEHSLDDKGWAPLIGFAGFHIDDAQGGSDKYIQGHLIATNIVNGGSGTGGSTFFGTYMPPRLGYVKSAN